MEHKNSPKWKTFEKLVAALHKVEQSGAIVRWNEKINKRQFDVTVRFRQGLYEFLTVIECKDYGKPIKAEKIDALVTKSKDAKADKAVMISANGYQRGAKEVAEKHNISLLTLKSLKSSSEDLANSLSPVLSLSNFRFSVIDENYDYLAIPEETGVMRSLLRKISIIGDNFNICPEDMVKQHLNEFSRIASSFPQTFEIVLLKDAELVHPNNFQRIKVKSLLFDYVLAVEADLMEGFGYSDDPYLSEDIYEIKDELNNSAKFVDFSKMDLGLDTVLETGKFYQNPQLEFFYFCEEVNDKTATLCLIESYQFGGLLQATFVQNLRCSSQYIEITDEQEISRLRDLYEQYKARCLKDTLCDNLIIPIAGKSPTS